MRIISKFKDYYDSVQAYGQDENLVYLRKEEKTYIDYPLQDNDEISKLIKMIPDPPSGDRFIVGFCGNIYPVWKLKYDPGSYHLSEYEYCYSVGDIEKIFRKYPKQFSVEKFNEKTTHHSWRGIKFKKSSVQLCIEELTKYKKLNFIFEDNKVPSFLITKYTNVTNKGWKVILNPNLSKLQFYKLKDSFTAYQDIGQYLSGVLGLNDPETVTISDMDLKAQKGFGHKYAFKTEPSKHR